MEILINKYKKRKIFYLKPVYNNNPINISKNEYMVSKGYKGIIINYYQPIISVISKYLHRQKTHRPLDNSSLIIDYVLCIYSHMKLFYLEYHYIS